METHPPRRLYASLLFALVALAATTFLATPATATTYMSVEPVPNVDVVGQELLDNLVGLDFRVRARWADLLLDCNLVAGVINALASDGTVTTLNDANIFFSVAAGGFEGTTNPTYLFTIVDSGVNAASVADVETLVNALGYVLSQGGTIHFSPDDSGAYDFPLDYVTTTFTDRAPSGARAQAFFEHVGTVDPALFSGAFAGYTQLGAALLFLQPATDLQQFIDGMFEAAETFPNVEYGPLDDNSDPTSAQAGVAFRGNDWLADPDGSGYLDNVAQDPDADLRRRRNLNQWRAFHLRSVEELDRLARRDGLDRRGALEILERTFSCR